MFRLRGGYARLILLDRWGENLTEYEPAPDGACASATSAAPRFAGRTKVHAVTLSAVDGDPGVQIEMHIFVGSKARWDHIGGNAPRYFWSFLLRLVPPKTTNETQGLWAERCPL